MRPSISASPGGFKFRSSLIDSSASETSLELLQPSSSKRPPILVAKRRYCFPTLGGNLALLFSVNTAIVLVRGPPNRCFTVKTYTQPSYSLPRGGTDRSEITIPTNTASLPRIRMPRKVPVEDRTPRPDPLKGGWRKLVAPALTEQTSTVVRSPYFAVDSSILAQPLACKTAAPNGRQRRMQIPSTKGQLVIGQRVLQVLLRGGTQSVSVRRGCLPT